MSGMTGKKYENMNKKPKKKQTGVWRKTWGLQWEKLLKLYIVQMVYIVAVCMIMGPLIMRLLEILLKVHGYSYITAEMMLSFFTSPLFIVGFFVVLLVVCILLAIWHIYVYVYLDSVYDRGEASIFQAFLHTANVGWRICKKKEFSVIFLLAGIWIFQNVIALVLGCRHIPSVWYVMKNFLELRFAKGFVKVLLTVLFLHYFRHVFTIPYMIFEKKSLKEAKKKSWELLKKRIVRVMLGCCFWCFVTGVMVFLFYVVSMGISIVIISIFVSSELKIAVLCTVQSQLYKVSFLVSMLLGMTLQVTSNVVGFYTYKTEENEQKEVETDNDKLNVEERIWVRKRFLAVFLVVVLCIDLITVYDRIKNGGNITFEHMGAITITSHRGDSKNAPENTLPAVELALDTASDYIEIDVQETKDGEVVLMHDSTMTRTTGVNKKVSDLTLEEIKQLDAGSWFSDEYVGTQIPTLREVLEICKGKCNLNIEIKTGKNMPDLEEKVVELIEEYDFSRQCVVTSVYKESLKKVKECNKEIRTGYILSSAYGRYYLDKEIDFLSMRTTLITERVVRLSHKYGKEVYVWTVNSKEDAIRMSQLGVDNIITDRPVYMRNVLYEQGGHQTLTSLLKLSF